ncbi:WecB/TagA/CpsF family glycosyltransferase [Arachidicoccus sp.]|uniref:WecB/TagA/CpsF family glycosyltransferase n=1 Tax=Arachidicoccus sp. TaxID=1872624 RepID=UPI003D2270A6
MKTKNIPTVEILDCPVHSLTMQQTLNIIKDAIEQKTQMHHVVVNAAKLVHMRKDEELRSSVLACDIINADGQSVVWAAKILGEHLPERVSGIDLMNNLVECAYQKSYKIFFLGAKEEVVKKVTEVYIQKYNPDIIAGYRNGYFNPDEAADIASQIAASKADILFVAITSPKKEIFLNKYKGIINTPFIMGVGGSFDVVAGYVKRAPLWMQKRGLEWLFRVIQEPRRMWKRYLVTNTLFITAVIKAKLKRK